MRISQVGIIVLITLTILGGTNCSVYNRVIARKNLVDGANAFNGKKLDEAEQDFRNALKNSSEGSTENKTALLFLARTLHSKYAANRNEKAKAEEAIGYYQKVLAIDPADNSSFKAVASLYDNLGRTDDWIKWITDRSENTQIPPEQRSEAYTSLAGKQNTCANDITELPEVKKTVQKDGKPTFTFSKPSKPEDLVTLKGCVDKGMDLISKAMALETDKIKNAGSVDIKKLSDKDLATFGELVNTYESARSFNASLNSQSARLAEMEGRTADKDKFKASYDEAKKGFLELNNLDKKIKDEVEARQKAKEEAANGPSKNANTGNTNTK
jgi:tetratricopeptide (TPR) repeat protein